MPTHHIEKRALQQSLKHWFVEHKRPLPWRDTNDWYKVFLSEFLLQQTQVAQALPYYEKLITLYPTVSQLAASSEDALLRQWSGLGYYARARNLRKAAQMIVSHFNGEFPQNYKDALSLPGIGPYTASAILSIAFNLPFAVVDGNVQRVLARLFNLKQDLRQSVTQKEIRRLANEILPPAFPGLFNEALMELGALICQPAAPKCAICPLQRWCLAYQESNVTNVPFKSAAPPKKLLFQYVLLFVHAGRVLLVKRPSKGLLAGMWEFPSFETNPEQFKKNNFAFVTQFVPTANYQSIIPLEAMRHIYSHIDLRFKPLLVTTTHPFDLPSPFYTEQKWLNLKMLSTLAMHNAHKKILKNRDFRNWWETQNFSKQEDI